MAEIPPEAVLAAAQAKEHEEQAREGDIAVRAVLAALRHTAPGQRRAHIIGGFAGLVRELLDCLEDEEGVTPTTRDVLQVVLKQTNLVSEAFLKEKRERLQGLPRGSG